jgi:Xaa-Pro aminopeptidase
MKRMDPGYRVPMAQMVPPTAPQPQRLMGRMAQAAAQVGERGWDGLLVTPGTDLFYLSGYDAVPLERITCLVIRPDHDPFLVVPRLELLAAQASPVGDMGLDIITWDESDDPYRRIAECLPKNGSYAVDDHMWASKVLSFRASLPEAAQHAAGEVLHALRMRKDADEIEQLAIAGAAIDSVHAAIPELLAPGRTEAEIGADIAALILDAGHSRVDFVIVAAGPNGASPHHALSQRVVHAGEPIVIDIGGTLPSGYCSDSTRMYCIGSPPENFSDKYYALMTAQEAAVNAVKPGVTAGEIDHTARGVLAQAGLADYFIHRTGHGIGLNTHEEPYILDGSPVIIESGMAFSVEPGFYMTDTFGARIEDIVVCTDQGVRRLNNRPHELMIVE